jgi:hypothetical protein
MSRIRNMGKNAFVLEKDAIGRMIYVAHPVGGDVENNIRRAKAWVKYLEAGNPWVVFVSQWIIGVENWDDSKPEDRAIGLRRCFAQVERCDELWLIGPRVSSGMLGEAAHARKFDVKVVDFTGEGRDMPPTDPDVIYVGGPLRVA